MSGDKPLSQEDIDALMSGSADAGAGESPAAAAAPVQNIERAKLQNLVQETGMAVGSSIEMLLDVPMDVTIELGRTVMSIKDILMLGVGSVIELDKMAGDPVDIYVNNKLVARGEVVVIDENFGVRITSVEQLPGVGEKS